MAVHPLYRQSLYPAHLALGLATTILLSGCTVRHTPAEPTPVYSEGLPKGATPLAVERISINAPEAQPSDADEAPAQSDTSAATAEPSATPPSETQASEAQQQSSATPPPASTEAAEKTEAKAAPTKK